MTAAVGRDARAVADTVTWSAAYQPSTSGGSTRRQRLAPVFAGDTFPVTRSTSASLTAFHALRPDQPLWWDAGLQSLELLGLVHRCDEAIEIAEVLRAQWDAAVKHSARVLRRRGVSAITRTRMAALHALARSRVESSTLVAPDPQRALQAAERAGDETATVLARHALAESAPKHGDHVTSLQHYRALRQPGAEQAPGAQRGSGSGQAGRAGCPNSRSRRTSTCICVSRVTRAGSRNHQSRSPARLAGGKKFSRDEGGSGGLPAARGAVRALPGGDSRRLSAGQAARILASIAPPDAVAAARCELAADFIEDPHRIEVLQREARKKIDTALRRPAPARPCCSA